MTSQCHLEQCDIRGLFVDDSMEGEKERESGLYRGFTNLPKLLSVHYVIQEAANFRSSNARMQLQT